MRLLFAIARPFYLAYYVLAMTLGPFLPYVVGGVLILAAIAGGVGYLFGKGIF